MENNRKETFTRQPRDILKIMILQRWDYINNALELYYKHKAMGTYPNVAPVKSGMMALFNSVRSGMTLSMSKEEFKDIKDKFDSDDFETLDEGFILVSDWLYKKGLLKFDNLQAYDMSNTQDEDKAQGL